MDRLQWRLSEIGASPLKVESIKREAADPPPATAQRLIPAYARALLEQAEKHRNLVALDADLILDTGLIPFREKFPERFYECGIAEQDMVSMAGGMALKGLLPVVHSFACFLSARPNEQIYNNASERTKIIYVGSLTGVVPGGPGHSHQAVRDISTLAAIPGLTLVEPSCEAEVGPLLDWCINEATASCYVRLVSLPWEIPYKFPEGYKPRLGQGVTLIEGSDVVLIAAGPVMLSAAVQAAEILATDNGVSIKVINLPWLNHVDGAWLRSALGNCSKVFCLDNHYVVGGQGDAVARAINRFEQRNIKITCLGLGDFPPCGTNQQVISMVTLDAQAIAKAISN